MADRDVRVDQSPEDMETESGGGAAGPGDAGGGQGARGPGKGDPFGGETDVPEPEPEAPADGPPPMEADDGTGEGLQPGAGGSGGGGGLWGQVSDAYDDAEDAVHDAAGDAGDAAGDAGDAVAGAAGKVRDGAASLADDVEKEVAQEWRDAGVNEGGFDEHQGGWLHDPVGTVTTPFRAADRAYDAVEDDIAKAAEDSGVADVGDATADAADDAYDAWKTLDDTPGSYIGFGGKGRGQIEDSLADFDRDTRQALGDVFGPGADAVGGAVGDVVKDGGEALDDAGSSSAVDAVKGAYDATEDAVGDAYKGSDLEDAFDAIADLDAYRKVEDGVASLADDVEKEVAQEWRDAGVNEGGFDEHQGGWLNDPVGTVTTPFEAADRAYDAVEDDIAKAAEDSGQALGDAYSQGADVVEDTGRAVGDTIDGGLGSDDGGGSTVPALDDFGRDTEREPVDPLASEPTWDVTQQVAEQAGEQEAQDVASDLQEWIDDPGPVIVPEDGAPDGAEVY